MEFKCSQSVCNMVCNFEKIILKCVPVQCEFVKKWKGVNEELIVKICSLALYERTVK